VGCPPGPPGITDDGFAGADGYSIELSAIDGIVFPIGPAIGKLLGKNSIGKQTRMHSRKGICFIRLKGFYRANFVITLIENSQKRPVFIQWPFRYK